MNMSAEGKYKRTFCTMCKKVLKYKTSFDKHLKQCCSEFSKLDSFATMASNEKYSSDEMEVNSGAEFNDSLLNNFDSNQSLDVNQSINQIKSFLNIKKRKINLH